jgi:hypothetical protein
LQGKNILKEIAMKLISFWILGLVALSGCAATQELPPSGTHPAISADQVQLYQSPPAKYEMLGVISTVVPPGTTWDDSGNANAGFEDLKTQAALHGANGLLFDPNIDKATCNVSAGYHGVFYKVPMHRDPTTAMAKAIYVIEQ